MKPRSFLGLLSALVLVVALTSTAFGAVTISNVAISDSSVYATARYTITFQTAADLAVGDTIGIEFPAKFGLSRLGTTTGSSGTVDGTIATASDSMITVTLTDTVLIGTLHTIVLDSVTNPDAATNGADTYYLSVATTNDAEDQEMFIINDFLTQGTFEITNNQAGRQTDMKFSVNINRAIANGGYIDLNFPSGFNVSALNGKSATGPFAGTVAVTGQRVRVTNNSGLTYGIGANDSLLVLPYYIINSGTVGTHIVTATSYNSSGTLLGGGADTVTIAATTNIGYKAHMDTLAGLSQNFYLVTDSLRGLATDSLSIMYDLVKSLPDDGYMNFTFPVGWDISGLNGLTTGNILTVDTLGGETITVAGQTATVPNTGPGVPINADEVMRTRFLPASGFRSPYAAGSYTIGLATYTDSTTPAALIDSGTVTFTILNKRGIIQNVRLTQRSEGSTADSMIVGLNLNNAMAADDTLKLFLRGGGWDASGIDGGNAGGNFSGTGNVHVYSDTISAVALTGVGPGIQTLVLPSGIQNSGIGVDDADSTHQLTAWVVSGVTKTISDSGAFALDITDEMSVTSGSSVQNVTTNYNFSLDLDTAVPSSGTVTVTFPYNFNVNGVNGKTATGDLGGVISASNDSTLVVTVSSGAATGTRTLLLPSGIQNQAAVKDSIEIVAETKNTSGVRLQMHSDVISVTQAPTGNLEIVNYKRSNWVASASSAADTLIVDHDINVPVNGYIEVLYPAGFSGFSNLVNQTISTGSFRGVVSVPDTTSSTATTVRVKLNAAASATGQDSLFLPSGIVAPSTTGSYTIQARTLNSSYIVLERYGSVDSTVIADPTAFVIDTLRASDTQAGATNVTYTLVFTTQTTIDQSSPDSIQVIFPSGFDVSGAGKGVNTSTTAGDVNPPVVRGDTMLSFEAITANITAGEQRLVITGINNPSTNGTYTIKVRTWDRSAGTTLETNPSVASETIDIALSGQTISAAFTLDSTTTDLHGASFAFKFKAAYSPGFTGDEGWTLWMHTDPDLTSIDSTYGGIRIAAGNTTGSGSTSQATASITADTRMLGENVTYYLYATLPSSPPYANNSVVAVSSTAFTVRHQPIVNTSTSPIEPSSTTGNVNLNSGTASPTATYNIQWAAIDYNSSTLDVKLWLSTADSLGLDQITQDGSAVTALAGATQIGTDATISKNTTTYTLNITSPTTVAKGVYYVYVTVHDGSNYNLARSGGTLTVKHAPAITLDNPGKTGVSLDSIDAADRLAMPIYWGTSGAYDRDDSTPSISLYLATVNTTSVTTLTGHSSVINLTAGGAISLDQSVTNSTTNSLLTVRLDELKDDGLLPTANTSYYVYAVINDGTDQILEQAATQVKFTYTPKFTFKASFGGSGAKAAKAALGDDRMKLRKGDQFRINFDSYDLDDDQQIRLVACPVSGLDAEDFDPGFGGAHPYGTSSWLITSTDGTKGVGPSEPNVDTLLTTDSVYVWDTGKMSGIVDGNYYIYAIVTNDDAPYEFSNDSTEVFTSDGTVNLSGATGVGTPPSFTVSLSPNVVAVTEDEILTFDVVVNTASASANEISFFLNVPDSVFTVLDEDGDNSPFFYTNATYMTDVTALKDTMYTNAADTSTYLDFRKFRVAGGATASDAIVASFKVQAKGNLLIRATDRNISFVQDEANDRVTQLSESGVTLPMLMPSPAMKVRTLPLARITGNVPLEGRTDFTTTVTMELREDGTFTPITNALFNSSNDIDPATDGVQVQTDASGAFELVNIPSGTYDLVAFVTNYMTGQAIDIELVPGELHAGANPVFGDDNELGGPKNYLELRGGDVSSGNGVGVPDNVVDSDDIQYIQNNFGAVAAAGDLGDINGNGEVDFTDFLITAGNVGEEGVEPTFNKEGGRDNSGSTIKLVGIPEMMTAGAEFEVGILVQNVKDLKGYIFTLMYDNDAVELVGDNALIEGDFLYSAQPSANSAFFSIDDRKGLILVNSLLGNPQTAQGTGEIMRVRFRAIADGPHPDISLADVQLANSAYELTSINSVADVPTDFALMQNYPNPFNPETRIRFNIPEASRVVLKIYNILGQEVRTLMNDQMRAGYHNLIWDGTNSSGVKVSSGVYIYRIKAANFSAVKKMVMLK